MGPKTLHPNEHPGDAGCSRCWCSGPHVEHRDSSLHCLSPTPPPHVGFWEPSSLQESTLAEEKPSLTCGCEEKAVELVGFEELQDPFVSPQVPCSASAARKSADSGPCPKLEFTDMSLYPLFPIAPPPARCCSPCRGSPRPSTTGSDHHGNRQSPRQAHSLEKLERKQPSSSWPGLSSAGLGGDL